MREAEFRDWQWTHRFDPHVAPLNKLVEELTAKGWLPYIPPMYGGVNARLLSLLRDPGPKTRNGAGSGFLSMENDDASAEAICNYCLQARIDASDIVPWNAYPWYINRKPTSAELEAGMEPLADLIGLLPKLRVVMLHGGSAKHMWHRFAERYVTLGNRNIHVIETYHTSRQAFWHRDPAIRQARRKHLEESFKRAAEYLEATRI
jgi:hypothetical protein